MSLKWVFILLRRKSLYMFCVIKELVVFIVSDHKEDIVERLVAKSISVIDVQIWVFWSFRLFIYTAYTNHVSLEILGI